MSKAQDYRFPRPDLKNNALNLISRDLTQEEKDLRINFRELTDDEKKALKSKALDYFYNLYKKYGNREYLLNNASFFFENFAYICRQIEFLNYQDKYCKETIENLINKCLNDNKYNFANDYPDLVISLTQNLKEFIKNLKITEYKDAFAMWGISQDIKYLLNEIDDPNLRLPRYFKSLGILGEELEKSFDKKEAIPPQEERLQKGIEKLAAVPQPLGKTSLDATKRAKDLMEKMEAAASKQAEAAPQPLGKTNLDATKRAKDLMEKMEAAATQSSRLNRRCNAGIHEQREIGRRENKIIDNSKPALKPKGFCEYLMNALGCRSEVGRK